MVGEDEIPTYTPLGFEAMAETAGLPKKLGYSLTEVSKATGVSYSVVCRSAASSELKNYLPRGRHGKRQIDNTSHDRRLAEGRKTEKRGCCSLSIEDRERDESEHLFLPSNPQDRLQRTRERPFPTSCLESFGRR